MAIKPTPEQENAILARGNVLVSAAAGSGKTAVLVERVIKLLSDTEHPIDANRLLIVTFTNAAANEMRTRIEKRLFEEIQRTGNRHLARQRLLIYGAKICTIDAFCIDFVRTHFAKLNIDPDFKVADAAQEQNAIRFAFNQTFSEMSKDESDGFSIMMDCLSSAYGVDEFKNYVLKVWSYCRSLPFPEVWLHSVKKSYAAGDYSLWSKSLYKYAEQVVLSNYNSVQKCLVELENYPYTEKYYSVLSSAITQLEDLSLIIAAGDWDKIREALQIFSLPSLTKTKADPIIREAVKKCKSDFTDAIRSLLKLFNYNYTDICECTNKSGVAITKLIDFVLRFSTLFTEEMHRVAAYPFDMIERMALQLLCYSDEDGNVIFKEQADALCSDYEEILVDEYQDTNDLQDTLFRMLSSQNGNLFTVGDVKQSIYGFRHANPNNFLLRKKALPNYIKNERDGKIDLSNNFRSRSDICSFINFTFGHLMREQTARIDYAESEKLVYSANFANDTNGGVEYHLIEREDRIRSREETEAAYIARYIKQIVDNGTLLQLNGKERAATYGDFAVLMQSPSSRAAIYAEEFRRHGIPVSIESKSFYETAEISLALSVLKVINNPSDDIALLAVIMSGLFGFSANKIAQIKIDYKADTLIGRITAAATAGDIEASEFLSKFSKLRTLSTTARLGVLVGQMYEDTGILLMMSARENGAKRRENLLRLLNMADAFTSDIHTSTLSSFLRSIENSKGNSIKTAPPAGTDAVRIMSIHASKGLQFPYCILACNTQKFNIYDNISRLVVEEELGIGLKYVDKTNHFIYETLARKAISLKLHSEMIAEKIRLLYVAMTRAEYKLDIVICDNNFSSTLASLKSHINSDGTWNENAIISAQGYSSWLLLCALTHESTFNAFEKFGVIGKPYFNNSEPVRITFSKPSASSEPQNTTATAQASDILVAQMRDNFNFEYLHANLQNIPSKLSVSELTKDKNAIDYAFSSRPAFAQNKGMTAAEKGTANHKFLQYCDFAAVRLNLEDEISRLYEYEYLSEAEIEALDKNGLQKFFSSGIFNRLIQAKKLYKEYPFILPFKAVTETDEYSIVQGVADCVAITDDGCLILDYKTDKVSSAEELVKRYADQVSFYATAIKEIFDLPILEKGIYSLHLGEYIQINE